MSFKKVEESDTRLYGPRKLLVCGFTSEQQSRIAQMIENECITLLPVVFVTNEHAGLTMTELLLLPDNFGYRELSELEPAIILSGITESELHNIIAAYKKLKLPPPLWATLTPSTENWKLSELLAELVNEREALKKARMKKY